MSIHSVRLFMACMALSFLVAVGCEGQPAGTGAPPPPPAGAGDESNDSTEAGDQANLPALDPETIEITPASLEDLENEIKKHEGKVVLVDFWATWCQPCIKNFPHVMTLKQAHDDLVLVTVSFDSHDELDGARRFLATQRAQGDGIVNLIATADADPFETFAVDGGAIPNYWIYDREGNQVARLSPADPTATEPFTPERIDEVVEELLSKSS